MSRLTRHPIPFLDLRAQYRALKPEIDQAIRRVLDRGQFILGPEGEALEREVGAYCGTRDAVAVGSGTDALELTLRAWGLGPGDEVITSAFSFFATAEAICAVGATPVFVDIEPDTYNLDPVQVASRVTTHTKAIIPVHLFGHPADMDPLMATARQHRLKVLEDCAQAIGAEYHGRRAGSLGDAGALSFYPTKNLGAYGDGGMVVTSDSALAKRLRLLRHHGDRGRYDHVMLGKNSRLDELQAAVLRVKLQHLARWTRMRRRLAREYSRQLSSHLGARVRCPHERAGCRHVYHLYVVRVPARDRVGAAMARAGIDAPVYYPRLLPQQRPLAGLASERIAWPRAKTACREVLAIPLSPELRPQHHQAVVQALARSLRAT